MKAELRRVGNEQVPVVVIDEFSGAVEDIIDIAAGLAPFPALQGLR
jgi:glutaredoxin